MKAYIFRLDWGQTDIEMIVVRAISRQAAEAYLMRHGDHGPRYIYFYGEVDKIVEI
jgi:hypothetical protein